MYRNGGIQIEAGEDALQSAKASIDFDNSIMQAISNISIKERLNAAQPAKAKLALAPAPERRLLNRELSLIEFFRQVLDEAREERNPLLERLRFLTIFSSIVDEFFMVRVSGLKEEIEHGWDEPSLDGMTAAEQLTEIRNRLQPMVLEQMRCLKEDILPALASAGIVVVAYESLTKAERDQADDYFAREVFPVLTPLAVDPAHPFPLHLRLESEFRNYRSLKR